MVFAFVCGFFWLVCGLFGVGGFFALFFVLAHAIFFSTELKLGFILNDSVLLCSLNRGGFAFQ